MAIDKCHLSYVSWLRDTGLPAQEIETLFEEGDRKGLRADYVEKIENILAVLNRARAAEDMNLPGFRLHALKGDLKGFHAVTVRANYRVIFRFENGHAFDVDLVDYH